ncbi:hypothetical protein A9168_09150 [Macellibacteroides sp. HH-ZS]|nr:hypothetical protein A9168_09150 [Macellibacteroides sp. HH-ZS]
MKPILKISELFKISWKQTRAQIWVLAGLLIGFTIISFTLSIFSTPDPIQGLAGYTLGIIFMNILSIIFSMIFSLGYLKNIFQALDGDEPQFSAYGQQARKILTYFIANLLLVIIVGIGLCLLILPGIYLGVRLQYFTAVIVEDNGGIISSMKRSWEITKGNFWPLFLLGLTYFGIAILGILIFVVGIFVAYPLIYMMYAASYRVLSTPVAADVFDAVKIEE